jgi:hypothetical protein
MTLRLLLTSTLVLLTAAGCTTPTAPPLSGTRLRASSAPAASPSPSGPDAKQELVAALRRTHAAAYKFAVRADLPDKQRVQGGGAFDPKQRRFTATTNVTGGKDAQSGQRIVVSTDSFSRERSGQRWVHLDLKRIKPDDTLLAFDMKDPTGLAKFISSIESVERTGPNKYRGEFEATQKGDPFVPIGAPSVWSFSLGNADFTATTDAGGWVTSISLELPDKAAKLKMTTTLSDHGKPTGVAKPKSYGEAADFYYK